MDGYDQGKMAGGAMDGHESASRMSMQAPEVADSEGWKLQSVSFSPAENGGVVANCSKTKKRPPPKDGGYQGEDYDSKQYAFSTIEEAAEYLMSELGQARGSSGSPMGAVPTPRG